MALRKKKLKTVSKKLLKDVSMANNAEAKDSSIGKNTNNNDN